MLLLAALLEMKGSLQGCRSALSCQDTVCHVLHVEQKDDSRYHIFPLLFPCFAGQ